MPSWTSRIPAGVAAERPATPVEAPLSDDLISGAPAAARYTGLKPRTIYNLVEHGHLSCIRKGRTLFFRKSELDRAFSSQAAQ